MSSAIWWRLTLALKLFCSKDFSWPVFCRLGIWNGHDLRLIRGTLSSPAKPCRYVSLRMAS